MPRLGLTQPSAGQGVGYVPVLDLRQEPMLMQERLAEAVSWKNELHWQTVQLNRCKGVDRTLEVSTTKEVKKAWAMRGTVGPAADPVVAILSSYEIEESETSVIGDYSSPLDTWVLLEVPACS